MAAQIESSVDKDNQITTNILVVGKIGTGKSALVNGIIRKKSVLEGSKLSGQQTTRVSGEVINVAENIVVSIWDTPGLEGIKTDECLLHLSTHYTNTTVFLYCISMCDPHHFDWNRDIKAMKKLTETLGHNIWNHTLVVLTFANDIITEAKEKFNNDMTTVGTHCTEMFSQWEEIIYSMVHEQVGVPRDLARRIPVCMAGHMKQPKLLPDHGYWFDVLCKQIASVIDKLLAIANQDQHTSMAQVKTKRKRYTGT